MPVVSHIKKVVKFYRGAGIPLHFESDHSLEITQARLTGLNREKNLNVSVDDQGRLKISFIRYGKPITTIQFDGRISGSKGRALVSGDLKLDSAFCGFVIIFCFIVLILFPTGFLIRTVGMPQNSPGLLTGLGSVVVLVGILEFGFSIGRTYKENLLERFRELLKT